MKVKYNTKYVLKIMKEKGVSREDICVNCNISRHHLDMWLNEENSFFENFAVHLLYAPVISKFLNIETCDMLLWEEVDKDKFVELQNDIVMITNFNEKH